MGGAHAAMGGATPMLFVRFTSGEHAQNAIAALENQPFDPESSLDLLHAAFARRELNIGGPGSSGPQRGAWGGGQNGGHPALGDSMSYQAPLMKRGRVEAWGGGNSAVGASPGGQIDTLAVLGLQ